MILTDITNAIETLLTNLIASHSIYAYTLVFLVLFIETGIVIVPFLPGDSIIFLLGALCFSRGLGEVFLIFVVLSLAAIFGDSFNYVIGRYFGNKIIARKWINKRYITKTENFYHKYGAKTIILARFVPIVRTIAPFVAGIGRMNYKRFVFFNIIGGIMWVLLFLFAGYFFGNIPIVKNNLSLVILLIIAISVLIPVIEYLKNK